MAFIRKAALYQYRLRVDIYLASGGYSDNLEELLSYFASFSI
jgi:hypothetical protein